MVARHVAPLVGRSLLAVRPPVIVPASSRISRRWTVPSPRPFPR